jgi:hypothetical protein
MHPIDPKTAERIHRAVVTASAAFVGHIALYKLGWRGRFHGLEASTSWAEVVQAFPKHVSVALVFGVLTFLLWPRR